MTTTISRTAKWDQLFASGSTGITHKNKIWSLAHSAASFLRAARTQQEKTDWRNRFLKCKNELKKLGVQQQKINSI